MPITILNSNMLRTLACIFMLTDHLWATVVSGNMWMTNVGRLAFPIFAFQIAEGYIHTSNYRKYTRRLLLFALISEIPFNLMQASSPVYPFHQNVMFTLLLGLVSIHAIDTARSKWHEISSIKTLIKPSFMVLGCLFLSVIGFVDYGFWGVMTVIMFYLFRDFRGAKLLQLAFMFYANLISYRGMYIPITFLGHSFELQTQGFAVLALIPIWLYNGKKGLSSKALQYGFYAFYPVHMLILALIQMYH